MKKITIVLLLTFTFFAMQTIYVAAKSHKKPPPEWIVAIKTTVQNSFKTQVTLSEVKRTDHLDGYSYEMYRLEGMGKLTTVSRPFEIARDIFLESKSKLGVWQEDYNYAADGHASASFGFRRANQLCLSSVWSNSSDDDSETNHTPNKFWFSIDCREDTQK